MFFKNQWEIANARHNSELFESGRIARWYEKRLLPCPFKRPGFRPHRLVTVEYGRIEVKSEMFSGGFS
jgi:hypothetical protein